MTLFRPTGKWRAQISAGGKTLSLGDHDSEVEAARAWDRAAVHKSGRAARTNFPLSDYEAEMGALQGEARANKECGCGQPEAGRNAGGRGPCRVRSPGGCCALCVEQAVSLGAGQWRGGSQVQGQEGLA